MSPSPNRLVDELVEEATSSKPNLTGLRTHFSSLERSQIAGLKEIIRAQEEELSALRQALESAHLLEATDQSTVRPAASSPPGKKRRAFQLHLSDTHSREIVSLASTSGRNEHNAEIGRARLASVVRQAIEEMKKESRGANPVHFTVWGGGDWMVNADLHYKMERCVDDEPLVEMEHVYVMLKEELARLRDASVCDSVSFVGSFSNHGRDTEKMAPGIEANRSYDTAIYRRLRHDFPEIGFQVAETNWSVEDVCGFRMLYTHGHAKKCSVGKSSVGIMVPNWRFLSEMRLDHRLNGWAQGHTHTQSVLWGNRFCHIQNGCLVGENGYSNSEGYSPEGPSQNLVVVDLDNQVVEKVIALRPGKLK